MKKLHFAAAALLMLAMQSCSSSDDVTTQQEGSEGSTVYTQVVVSIPNSDLTRGDAEDSGVYEQGTESEYKVNTVNLFFFKNEENSDETLVEKVTVSSFPSTTSPTDADKQAYYTSAVQPITIESGTYRIYATVNEDISLTKGTSKESDLKKATFKPVAAYGLTIPTAGIPMSSRDNDGNLYTTVSISDANTKTNPAQINLTVERAWSKITLAAGNSEGSATNEYKVYKDGETSGTQIATVTLKNYQIVNLPTQYNVFRQVAPLTESNGTVTVGDVSYGKINATNTYVIAPQTTAKTFIGNSVASLSPALMSTTGFTNMPVSTDYQTLTYSLENTMYKDFQKRGYVTGINFKAKIKPVEYYNNESDEVQTEEIDGDIYYFNDLFFTSLDAINKHFTYMNASESNYADLGIYKYTGGYTYYTYWIKHFDNGQQGVMGEMEYALVRNNVYNLKVTSVALPGDMEPYDPTDPDNPGEDVETNKVYIQALMTVKPWIVRTNNIQLGK